MIGHHHDQGLPVLTGKVQRHAHRLVESQEIVYAGRDIVIVGAPVDFAAFHHQEESAVGTGQEVEREAGHLGYRRLVFRAVYFKGHVLRCEQAPDFACSLAVGLFHARKILDISDSVRFQLR